MAQTIPTLALNDGQHVPQLGFGTWKIDDNKAPDAVQTALDAGYRLIDTASMYGNEEGVGRGIARAGVPREEIFLATKLWNDDQGFDATLRAFDASASKLGTDYLDLYLIHWPTPRRDLFLDTWKAFIRLQQEHRVRSIGVCNFQREHLQRLIAETGVKPVLNQIELHPDFSQRELVDFNTKQGVVTEAWSPLGQGGDLLKNATLAELSQVHGKSVAQVIIRWHLQRNHMVIPKSEHAGRIRENLAVFDFRLTDEELRRIDALDRGKRLGPHPDELN